MVELFFNFLGCGAVLLMLVDISKPGKFDNVIDSKWDEVLRILPFMFLLIMVYFEPNKNPPIWLSKWFVAPVLLSLVFYRVFYLSIYKNKSQPGTVFWVALALLSFVGAYFRSCFGEWYLTK